MYRKKYGRITPRRRRRLPGDGRRVSARRSATASARAERVAPRHHRHADRRVPLPRPNSCMGRLRAELDFTSVDNVMRGGLHEYLDGLQLKMNAIDSSLRDDFVVRVRQIATQAQSQHRRAPTGQPADGNSRRAAPQDGLPLRPAGDALAADRAAAPGAALPHADRRATRCAIEPTRALHQLAAGPARQLPGAARVSRADRRVLASRSIWSPR